MPSLDLMCPSLPPMAVTDAVYNFSILLNIASLNNKIKWQLVSIGCLYLDFDLFAELKNIVGYLLDQVKLLFNNHGLTFVA